MKDKRILSVLGQKVKEHLTERDKGRTQRARTVMQECITLCEDAVQEVKTLSVEEQREQTDTITMRLTGDLFSRLKLPLLLAAEIVDELFLKILPPT